MKRMTMKDADDGRCKNCEYCSIFNASMGMRFLGCCHKPYRGKWVAEIKDCPKKESDIKNKYRELLEECAEEIENCYGRETELTIKVRELVESEESE